MARRQSSDEHESMAGRPYAAPKQSDEDLLRLMRERSVLADDGWQDNYDRAEESVDFVEGLNHWPADLLAAREESGQSCLVLNDMPIFVDRICGEQLQNRQSIHISPADSIGAETDFVGEKGRKRSAASVREGLIRAIEYTSNAQAHYDRAFQHAVDGGFGWLRVFTRYASKAGFDQELVIASLKNRWSACLDPEADEPDMSDARFGFVHSSMLRSEFLARFPGATIGALSDLDERNMRIWGRENRVTVSEYMTRDAVERELLLLSDGHQGYADELRRHERNGMLVDDDGLHVVDADGNPIRIVRRRPVTEWRVTWRKATAWSVLEGPITLPFSTVPLVPVQGRVRDHRDGSTRLTSAIHHAMDTKRMEEFWMSAATSRVALAPLAPFVGDARAFEGFESFWNAANRRPYPYLPYNSQQGTLPPPQRETPPSMPVAELALTGTMHDRTKASIGIFDASLGAASNETSGRAINARDRQSSTSTFVFGDNLGKAIRRVGLLLNEALPVVYDTERSVGLRNEDETTEWITVNQVVRDQDDLPAIINSLAGGEFDVVVSAGPAYITKRQEAAESQLAIMQAAPDTIPLMLDTFAVNSDWPGSDKLALRARKLMDPKLLTQGEIDEMREDEGGEVDPETGQPADQQQDPEAQQQAMAVQAMEMQAQVQARQADADMAVADAKIAEAEARKAKAAADMAEAQMRMAALQQGGLAPQLPTVGSPAIIPGTGQETPNV